MKDETFPPINGNEVQINGFQYVIHGDDDIEERIGAARYLLQKAFKGETAHKIIRVSYQRGQKSFIFNAGFEKEMYNEVVEWIKEVTEREYYPLRFEFRNFVSYNPPEVL